MVKLAMSDPGLPTHAAHDPESIVKTVATCEANIKKTVHKLNNLLTVAVCRIDLLPDDLPVKELLSELMSQMFAEVHALGESSR